MSTKKVIKFNHEKLGEIVLNTDPDGRPFYDKETTLEILFKGIDFLHQKGVLTLSQKEEVKNQLQDCDVALIHNFGSMCGFNYQYHCLTGKAKLTALQVDDNSKYLDNERMVNNLLNLLCEAITTVLYNNINLENGNKTIKPKGKEWEKYALVLLPEEEVISNKFRNQAIEYLTNGITNELKEKLMKINNSNDEFDMIDYFADDYVNVVMSDYDEFEEGNHLTVEDYIGDQLEDYEFFHKG